MSILDQGKKCLDSYLVRDAETDRAGYGFYIGLTSGARAAAQDPSGVESVRLRRVGADSSLAVRP
jgi:hypothetical protein